MLYVDDKEVRSSEPDKDHDGDGSLDVLDPDSDGDGLFDGTETGRDCSGPGTDAARNQCIADADQGATTTSVLVGDTDHGGVKDGDEDTNKDGKVDTGERDPLNPSDDTMSDADVDSGEDATTDSSIDVDASSDAATDDAGDDTGANADDGTLEGGGFSCAVPSHGDNDNDGPAGLALVGAALALVAIRRKR